MNICPQAQKWFYIFTTGLAVLVQLSVLGLPQSCPVSAVPPGMVARPLVPSVRGRAAHRVMTRPRGRASCAGSWVNRLSGPDPPCDLEGPSRL